MVLIFTNSADFHTDAVITKISKTSKGDYFRLNTEFLHRDYDISVAPNKNYFSIKNIANGKFIDSSIISCAWWRRPEKLKILDDEIPQKLQKFLRDEFWLVLRSIVNIINENCCKIITYHAHLNRAKDKAIQQLWAEKSGFKLPKQLITTNNDSFQKNFKNVKQIISKSIDSIESIRDNESKKDYVLYANVLSKELKTEIINHNVKINISYFQEKIDRKFELRVIAFGKYVFPFVIDENSYDVDWRRIDPDSINFKLIKDRVIINLCKNYLKLASLNYGAFDLIIDNNNDVFFIECNPNGQFLFCDINEKTSLLSDFVNYLYE